MKSILPLGAYVCFILLVSSCTQERTESETIGNFRIETTTKERKRIGWPGFDFVDMKTRLFYKEQEVDMEELCEQYLKNDDAHAEFEEMGEIYPLTSYPGTHLYARIYLEDYASLIVVIQEQSGKLVLTPLLKPSTEDQGLPILSKMDSINPSDRLFGNYIISEKNLKTVRLPEITRYYPTFNGDSSNMDAYADHVYGTSPDGHMLVRSFHPSMIQSYPQFASLFVTELSTGKTVEFPLLVGDSALADIYSQAIQADRREWFRKTFTWSENDGEYKMNIK